MRPNNHTPALTEKDPGLGAPGRGMRRCARVAALAPIVATGALALSTAAGNAAVSPKKTHLACTLQAYNVKFPRATGLSYADLRCSKPFGHGVQRATYALGSPSPGVITSTGTFTNYGARGTTYGSSSLRGGVSGTKITLRGTLKVLGGTGAYSHVRGTGSIKCTTADAGKTYSCKVSAALTGVATG